MINTESLRSKILALLAVILSLSLYMCNNNDQHTKNKGPGGAIIVPFKAYQPYCKFISEQSYTDKTSLGYQGEGFYIKTDAMNPNKGTGWGSLSAVRDYDFSSFDKLYKELSSPLYYSYKKDKGRRYIISPKDKEIIVSPLDSEAIKLKAIKPTVIYNNDREPSPQATIVAFDVCSIEGNSIMPSFKGAISKKVIVDCRVKIKDEQGEVKNQTSMGNIFAYNFFIAPEDLNKTINIKDENIKTLEDASSNIKTKLYIMIMPIKAIPSRAYNLQIEVDMTDPNGKRVTGTKDIQLIIKNEK